MINFSIEADDRERHVTIVHSPSVKLFSRKKDTTIVCVANVYTLCHGRVVTAHVTPNVLQYCMHLCFKNFKITFSFI